MLPKKTESIQTITLKPEDNERLFLLCGQLNENLKLMEHHLGVEINNRGHHFQIIGIPKLVNIAYQALQQLYLETENNQAITGKHIQLLLQTKLSDYETQELSEEKQAKAVIQLGSQTIKPRTPNQYHYITNMEQADIHFGIGPSGTGKTYLAVAAAIAALEKEMVSRIVLVRPAVEAGENLGFLPGDLAQKIDPYLRPIYDALYEMLGIEKVSRLIGRGIIEIAPLAFMRGRTLNDSFIILDEGQNTTKEQMKMFLTRIGFNSKAVITGDITQIDLPKSTPSGLRHAISLLHNIDQIHFTFFTSVDVVRHPLVQRIIEAYEKET